jgi:amino-acid N-acetyltransferase
MLNEVTIARFAPAQQDALWALLAEAGLPDGGLADHLATTLVALQGDQVVGSAALELYGAAALLRSVAVADAQRNQGIGSRLLDHAMALARQHGVQRLYLLTERAAGYFARRGFRPISRAEVEPAVLASLEFTTVCPASAQAMRRDLAPAGEQ